MKDKEKVIPNLLLGVEWGIQCSRAIHNLHGCIQQYRLELFREQESNTDPEKVKEYKLLVQLLDKVEEWADTGKPWID